MLVSANIFQPLISVFATVIKFFHNDISLSWGWSIILLTVCVRMVMLPLTAKQFHSMRRLQQHQPEMKAIQKRYKEDKQRQQQELMKFYQENGINPLASCLPLVAQLPVFISLFYMLRQNLRTDICPAIQHAFQAKYAAAHHIALHAALGQTTQCGDVPGAGFLFIKDITNNAHGVILIVLCLLYVGTQMASTVLMSAPTMDKTQRRMMMFMPVFFVLFIIKFPAGLLIYWITTNTWTMLQQYTLKRIIGAPMLPETIDVEEHTKAPAKMSGGRASSSAKGSGADAKPASRFSSLRRNHTEQSSEEGNAPKAPSAPPRPPQKKKKRSGRRR